MVGINEQFYINIYSSKYNINRFSFVFTFDYGREKYKMYSPRSLNTWRGRKPVRSDGGFTKNSTSQKVAKYG